MERVSGGFVMKCNLGELVEKAELEWEVNDPRVKTRVWVSELKPSTGKKLELLALEFQKYRLGVE